ncbi:MAG: hypothetical protein WC473_02885 [Patescibacteria group bacterium]
MDKKLNNTTTRLRKIIQNQASFADLELYKKWLDFNPEEMGVRILSHTNGNKKLRGELVSKIILASEVIDKVLDLDYKINNLINAGAIKFTNIFTNEENDGVDLEATAYERKKMIAIIEQSFSDIKKYID